MNLGPWDQRLLSEPRLEELLMLFDRRRDKEERVVIRKITHLVRAHQVESAYHWLIKHQMAHSKSLLHQYLAGRLAGTFGDLTLSRSHLTQAIYSKASMNGETEKKSQITEDLIKYTVTSLMNLLSQCGLFDDLKALIQWRLGQEISYETYFMLGKLEERNGSIQRAVIAYDKALEISPESHFCRLSLAKVLSALGRVQRADSELKRLRTDDKNNDVVWALSGSLFLARSEEKRGLHALRKAIRINHRSSIAHTLLGDHYRHLKIKRAIKHYHLALVGDRPVCSLYKKLSTIYQQLERYDEAITQLSMMRYFVAVDDQAKIQTEIRDLTRKLENQEHRNKASSWWRRLIS